MNVERWAWYSVGLNVLLAGLHALIAAASGSLAVAAELVHSSTGFSPYSVAADLIPEVKAHADLKANILHFAAFALGFALMLAVKLLLGHWAGERPWA